MKRVAIIVDDGYEDLEVWYPKLRCAEQGFYVMVATPDGKEKESKHGYPIKSDMQTSQLKVEDFDAVIVHGGIKGAENLRMDKNSVRFVKEMFEQKKVVASICHGAWVLISAFIVKGKKITCYEGMKDDLIAAGANYIDETVVVDENLVSSRKPADLPVFIKQVFSMLKD